MQDAGDELLEEGGVTNKEHEAGSEIEGERGRDGNEVDGDACEGEGVGKCV